MKTDLFNDYILKGLNKWVEYYETSTCVCRWPLKPHIIQPTDVCIIKSLKLNEKILYMNKRLKINVHKVLTNLTF